VLAVALNASPDPLAIPALTLIATLASLADPLPVAVTAFAFASAAVEAVAS
jgi:hypothetical protein